MEPNSLQAEATFYLLWGGCVQFFCAVVALPFYYFIARRVSKQSDQTIIRAFVIFNVFLLLWGCLGSYVFMSVAYDKLYVSVDRLVDWYAFLPFGQWVLDDGFGGDSHGYLKGDATLWQVQIWWLLIAIPTWLLAFICTKLTFPAITSHFSGIKIDNIRKPNKAEMATPRKPSD